LDQTRGVPIRFNRLGPVDAVIHNAGVSSGPHVLPVNIVAPYLLTALIHRPQRLVYVSSDMHHGGRADVGGLHWSGQPRTGSYSDSKLFVTTLAVAVARLWPHVYSNAVDPGWVPTKMGGPGAPDDLRVGHLTREWLATRDNPRPAPAADTGFTSDAAVHTRQSWTRTSKTTFSPPWRVHRRAADLRRTREARIHRNWQGFVPCDAASTTRRSVAPAATRG
jgi:NAD(P)-dependent dehydrogenase (short-subunit alcohol dehydrogenase family)